MAISTARSGNELITEFTGQLRDQAARHSKTPSHSGRGAAPIGVHDPFLMGWDTKVTADGVPKHRPSEILEGGLLGFLSGYGHEDILLRKVSSSIRTTPRSGS